MSLLRMGFKPPKVCICNSDYTGKHTLGGFYRAFLYLQIHTKTGRMPLEKRLSIFGNRIAPLYRREGFACRGAAGVQPVCWNCVVLVCIALETRARIYCAACEPRISSEYLLFLLQIYCLGINDGFMGRKIRLYLAEIAGFRLKTSRE